MKNTCSYVESFEAVDMSAVGTGPRSSVGRPVTSIFATGCDVHALTHSCMYVYTYDTYPYTGTYVHVHDCLYAVQIAQQLTDCTIYGNGIVATSRNCAQLEKEGRPSRRRETFRSSRRILKARLLCDVMRFHRDFSVFCVALNMSPNISDY